MSTWVIARLTFREASRRKILLTALLLGLVFLIVYGLGFYILRKNYETNVQVVSTVVLSEMANFILMAGLYAVNFLAIMMTVLTSVDTISGEISSGTIHTLVSKPLRRSEVFLGKWIGYALLITSYLILMVGGVLLAVYVIARYSPPNLLAGVVLIWINSLLLLSVSMLGGTMLSTLANGVLVFGLYGIAFMGGWVEQVGAILKNSTAITVGIVSSLIIPSEALWRRAAYEMQSPLSGALGGLTPFSSVSVPSTAMVVYALIYTGVILVWALRNFTRRDL
jgi:Cu-processing system permease protein